MKKKVLALLVIVFLLAGGYIAYTFKLVDAADQGLVLFGNVDIRDVSLGFRVPGRVAAMHFEEGDRVDAGTVLALLDAVPYEEEKALCEAELVEAQAALQREKKNFRRKLELIKSGAVSHGEYDDAVAARDEALARVSTLQAKLAQTNTRLGDTRLAAPSAGVILTRVSEPGTIVAAGKQVYSLALDSPVWIRAYVHEPELGKVFPGKKAVVHTDSGGVYDGQVGFISPQAEFTPKSVETTQLRTDLVYRLRIIVLSPDPGLRQGMPVTVVFKE